MGSKTNFQIIAAPCKVVMALIVLLIALALAQSMGYEVIHEIAKLFDLEFDRYVQTPQQVTRAENLTEEQIQKLRLGNSVKKVLPDGTFHQIVLPLKRISGRIRKERQYDIEIYDVNDNLIWKGLEKDNPFKYPELIGPQVKESATGRWDNIRNFMSQRWMRELQMITPEFSQAIIVPVQKDKGFWLYDP